VPTSAHRLPSGSQFGRTRMARPLVSVVIPCYNAGHCVEHALRSVLVQTVGLHNLEVIVVDDGSMDDSAGRARSVLSSAGVNYQVFAQANSGPSRARNLGIEAAAGEWIQFLDADDWLGPDKIAVQLAHVQGSGAPCDVVYSTWQRAVVHGSDWQVTGELRDPSIGNDAVLDLLADQNFLALGSYIVRAVTLQAVGGFDEQRDVIEDVHLLLRLAMHGDTFLKAPTPEPQMYYRQSETGQSSRDADAFVRGCFLNASMVDEWLREHGRLDVAAKTRLAWIYFGAARYFAGRSPSTFEDVMARLEALGIPLLPSQPGRLRILSWLVGFRAAASLAAQYRKVQAALRFP
jgi:glycosyltransferase involved in cell wall biosynthesis